MELTTFLTRLGTAACLDGGGAGAPFASNPAASLDLETGFPVYRRLDYTRRDIEPRFSSSPSAPAPRPAFNNDRVSK